MEFLLPSKARLAEAIKGDEEEEEGEGDMIDGLALLNDKLVGKRHRGPMGDFFLCIFLYASLPQTRLEVTLGWGYKTKHCFKCI